MTIYSRKHQKSSFLGPPLLEFLKIEKFFAKTLVWAYNSSFKKEVRWFRKKDLLLNSSNYCNKRGYKKVHYFNKRGYKKVQKSAFFETVLVEK